MTKRGKSMNYSLSIKVALSIVLVSACNAPLRAQSTAATCITTISVDSKDAKGQTSATLDSTDAKWLQQTLAKHYPGTCYTGDRLAANIRFDLVTSTLTKEADALSGTGNAVPTPEAITYPVVTLQISRLEDGKAEVLHTFRRTTAPSHGGALLHSVGDPRRDVMLDAIDWLKSNDPFPKP